MAIRARIGKVGRRGNGLAVYLRRDSSPDVAGATLLQHYSDGESVDRLIRMGSVIQLEPARRDQSHISA